MRLLLVSIALLFVAACVQAPVPAAPRPSALAFEMPELKQYLPQEPPALARLAPGMPERQAVLERATRLLGTPYLWGGSAADVGLDCSGFVSLALESGRQTTDTLLGTATVIEKEELLPGDLLNLETWEHPTKAGHVRIFAAWANAAHTKMWVFESRYPQGAVYHVVSYDTRYSPLRYDPLAKDSSGRAALIDPRSGASSP